MSISLSYDDRYLVTGGADRMVKIYDARDLKLLETLRGHKDTILAVKFRNFSNEFCTTGADRVLKLWDASERGYMDTL